MNHSWKQGIRKARQEYLGSHASSVQACLMLYVVVVFCTAVLVMLGFWASASLGFHYISFCETSRTVSKAFSSTSKLGSLNLGTDQEAKLAERSKKKDCS